MRKALISLILIIIAGTSAFFGIKFWQSQTLNAQKQEIKKVSHINLVALGDSLTEGVGDTQQLQGYSGRIAQKIRSSYGISVTMENFGKAGDRSDQIQNRLNTQPEFQKALKKANVIVMTVGGNDLQQLLLQNITSKNPQTLTKAVLKGQANYQEKLSKLLRSVRKSNSQAPIFIFGNYNPLYVHFPNREDFNNDVKGFNAINALFSKKDKKVHYVSSFDLTYGQFKTSSQRSQLIKQVESSANTSNAKDATKEMTGVLTGKSSIDNNWISNEDNYHPNNKGYQYMTSQLFKEMKKEQKQWLMKH
ncbi:MAG: SGNH/GDSL hydrolase family protein [Lactobacillaceae bacterium]|jgi:lysophospholipase L1-like esterase|nr:SGNH/GDSL hydrolase family protein [Lactobacillaceae bacterium]